MGKLFSFQIIKQSLKSAWMWWLISCFVISVNLFAFPSMTTEEQTLLAVFVETGILGNGIIFVTICAILFANMFITSQIDRGTLVVTLNTPITRKQIILSKMLVFALCMITISIFAGAMGSLSAVTQSASLDHSKWWKIVAIWSLYSFAIGGITFFIGCIFNKSKYSLGVSSVLLGSFIVLYMLSLVDNFWFLKYLSLQTLFATTDIIVGKSVVWQMVTLGALGVPLYTAGALWFMRKDLPL